MNFNLRLLYLYLFSFVGLLIVTLGGIRMVELGIKTFVFPDADSYEIYQPEALDGKEIVSKEELQQRQERDLSRQRKRDLSSSLAMVFVGVPLYLYHWKTIQKEKHLLSKD